MRSLKPETTPEWSCTSRRTPSSITPIGSLSKIPTSSVSSSDLENVAQAKLQKAEDELKELLKNSEDLGKEAQESDPWTEPRRTKALPPVQEPSTNKASKKPINLDNNPFGKKEDSEPNQSAKGNQNIEFYGQDLINEVCYKVKEKVESFGKLVKEDAEAFNSKIKSLDQKLDICIQRIRKEADKIK